MPNELAEKIMAIETPVEKAYEHGDGYLAGFREGKQAAASLVEQAVPEEVREAAERVKDAGKNRGTYRAYIGTEYIYERDLETLARYALTMIGGAK